MDVVQLLNRAIKKRGVSVFVSPQRRAILTKKLRQMNEKIWEQILLNSSYGSKAWISS